MDTADHDQPLLDDLALLSGLFAQVLQALAPKEVVARMEQLLRATPHEGRVGAVLSACPQEHTGDVLRAVAETFSHINLAERVHRLRRRRASLQPGASPQDGSLLAVARLGRDSGTTAERAIQAAQALRLNPVFTAHPTEATRGSLLRKEQRMAALLLERPQVGAEATLAALRAEMAAAWQTETLTEAPTVADEVAHVTFYLTQVIYPVVPTFFDGLRDALGDAFGAEAAQSYATTAQDEGPTIRFGTWVGGDMDGNPNVGPDTLRGTLLVQREALMRAYDEDLARLYDRLSQSDSRVGISASMAELLTRCERVAPTLAVPPRHGHMPYRRLIAHIRARLQPGGTTAHAPYAQAGALWQDLRVMAESLDAHSGPYGGASAVRRLMRRVATFGLHLAALDVRQDSLVHRAAVATLLGDEALALDTTARAIRQARYTEALDKAMAGRPPWSSSMLAAHADGTTPLGRMLGVFAALVAAREDFGDSCIGLYIISMCQEADDLLAVLLLAHAAGLTRQDASGRLQVPLQVAPLFETVPDLGRAPTVFAALCEHPIWRAHMDALGGTQEIMLGYSDSNKESGFLASRAALLTAEARLVDIAARHGVALKLFHGRGGTASRGGSKPRAAILASQDPAPHMRITEQGEIIHAKYGLAPVVLRTLELMGGALWQREMGAPPSGMRQAIQAPETYRQALHLCAQASREAYQALTAGTPHFFDYFNAATPIDVITRLRIGSRPPSRRQCQGLGDLRAIPWVFAWMQNRQMLPGWYGLGQGLEAGAKALGLQALRALYGQWPFFHNLMDDAAISLAKCDMAIGARYAGLAGGDHQGPWRTIEGAYGLACERVCAITEQPSLLHHHAVLQRSIARRGPLLRPLHIMQLDTLAAWRAGNREDDTLLRQLMLSVKALAKGLHNTG